MTITLNIQDILQHYFYSPYLDRTPIDRLIGEALAGHEQQDKLYHIELWSAKHPSIEKDYEGATLWRVGDWKIFSEQHNSNLASYWKWKHPGPELTLSRKQQRETEAQIKIKELEMDKERYMKEDNYQSVAMIEMLLSMWRNRG